MDIEQFSRWRLFIGRLGGLLCTLAMAAVLDGLVASFRQPFNVLEALPGQTLDVNGPAEEQVRDPNDLACTSDSSGIRAVVDKVHRGYFLGGTMWQGKLIVNPEVPAGKYTVTIQSKAGSTPPAAPNPSMVFRITVHPDLATYQQNAKSIVQRFTGWSPYVVAASLVPAILVIFGIIFLMSRKLEQMLAASGQAEVYRVQRGEGETAVAFGMGADQGLTVGMTLILLNEVGRICGAVEVREVSPQDAAGLAHSDALIKPGFRVALPGRG